MPTKPCTLPSIASHGSLAVLCGNGTLSTKAQVETKTIDLPRKINLLNLPLAKYFHTENRSEMINFAAL
jgi:hypothetical protein